MTIFELGALVWLTISSRADLLQESRTPNHPNQDRPCRMRPEFVSVLDLSALGIGGDS